MVTERRDLRMEIIEGNEKKIKRRKSNNLDKS